MSTQTERDIEIAAAEILQGGLVAIPTETVYGLAADATNNEAVARIFEAKGRPQFNPLIVHVRDIEMAARYAEFAPLACKLADHFWPGPLTIVAPRRADSALSLLVSAGLDTIGLRAPNHAVAQALLRATGRPLAAPSANISGGVSPTTADHVLHSLGGRVDRILDGGPCQIGVESTIVRVHEDHIFLLRPGGVSRAEIERAIGIKLAKPPQTDKPQAPGMLASHYAPSVSIRLNAKQAEEGEAFLGFGEIDDLSAPLAKNLSQTGDLREAAANLFAHLRAMDAECVQLGLSTITAAPIPEEGLGEAINDRLRRAAAPRV